MCFEFPIPKGFRSAETALLSRVCLAREVPPGLVAELIDLERAEKRWGINQALRTKIHEYVQSSTKKTKHDAVQEGRGRETAGDEIRFKSLRMQNFSLFADAAIKLEYDPERPVSLIEGGNGYGKSTILDAIRFLLYGKTKGELGKFLNRDAERPEARLEVELQIHSGLDGDVMLRRFADFEFSSGQWNVLREPVFVAKMGEKTLQDEDADAWVEAMLPRHVIGYFLFDAENSPVSSLAAEGPSGDVAEALEQVLGIATLRSLAQRLGRTISEIDGDLQRDADLLTERQVQAALERARADLDRAGTDLDDATRRLVKLQEDKEKADRNLENLFRRFDPREDDTRKEHERAAIDLKRREEALQKELRSAFPDLPVVILDEPLRYVARLVRRARTDETEASRREGALDAIRRIADLAGDGRIPWVEDPMPSAAVIAQRLVELLALAEVDESDGGLGLTESQAIEMEKLADRVGERRTPGEVLAELRDVRKEFKSLNVIVTDGQDPGTGGRAELDKLRRERRSMQAQCEKLALRIRESEERTKRLEEQRRDKEAEVEKLQRKLADAKAHEARTSGLRKQYDLASRTVEAVEDLAQRLRAERIDVLEKGATDMFRLITNKPDLYAAIQFDRENLRYSIVGMDGRPAPPDRSTGERAVMALAVVHGLLEASGRQLPLMVEAPLKPLDPVHTGKVLRHFYSGRKGQVVLLVKPDEIPAALLVRLKPRISRRILIERPNPEKEVSTLREIQVQ